MFKEWYAKMSVVMFNKFIETGNARYYLESITYKKEAEK